MATAPPASGLLPSGPVGDFETCKGFLDAQAIEEQTGEAGLFERERLILAGGAPGSVDSGAVNNCLVEVFRSFERNDDPTPGESTSLSIVRFQTPEEALSVFDSTLASALLSVEQIGDLAEVRQGVIGDNSYLLDIDAGGIGAIVAYVSGAVFVSMSSPSNPEGKALLNGAELVVAAQGVESRLPG